MKHERRFGFEVAVFAVGVLLGGCGDSSGAGSDTAANEGSDGASTSVEGSGGVEDGTDEGNHQGDPDGETCAEKSVNATRKPVEMLVLLDRSYSMRGTLWRDMGEALVEVVGKAQGIIDFGVIAFPSLTCESLDEETHCAVPAAGEIPTLAFGDPEAPAKIEQLFELESQGGLGTCGNTPTAGALLVAKGYLDGRTKAGVERAILLATDGAPNCNYGLDEQTCTCTVAESRCQSQGHVEYCLDDDRTVDAAKSVAETGYPVYVLGVGDSVDWEATMNAMAAAGKTGSYYPVTDPEKLVETMSAIAGAVSSCDFQVDWSSLPAEASKDPAKVNFYCTAAAGDPLTDENLIGYDPGCADGRGWDWAEDDVAHMCDDMCQKIKSGGCAGVTATFGCNSKEVIVK